MSAYDELHSRDLAALLYRLADFLDGATLTERAIDKRGEGQRWTALERDAQEARDLAAHLHDMKARLVPKE